MSFFCSHEHAALLDCDYSTIYSVTLLYIFASSHIFKTAEVFEPFFSTVSAKFFYLYMPYGAVVYSRKYSVIQIAKKISSLQDGLLGTSLLNFSFVLIALFRYHSYQNLFRQWYSEKVLDKVGTGKSIV